MTFTAKIKVTKVKVGLFSQNQSNNSKSWLFQLTSKLQKLEFAVSDYIKVMKGRDYHTHIFQQINHNSASAPSSLLMSPSASTFTTGVLTSVSSPAKWAALVCFFQKAWHQWCAQDSSISMHPHHFCPSKLQPIKSTSNLFIFMYQI